MRQFRFCTILSALLTTSLVTLAMPSMAQSPAEQPPAPPQSAAGAPSANAPADTPLASTEDRIETLMASLKRERTPEKAKTIANQIVSEWNDSGSATINLLMSWTNEAVEEKRNAAAFDFIDQVTLLDPDYAQAWYRRATINFAGGDTRKAMSDINQTLIKEPRHFPALASLTAILESGGRDELAMRAWEQYLLIYPADRDAQKEMQELSEKLAGTRS